MDNKDKASSFRNYFNLAKYEDLPDSKFDEALDWIENY